MRSGRSPVSFSDFDANAPYDTRLAALRSHGVALWDVLHKCRRIGSADSAIDPKSLVVNNFGELFANYPTITRVYFNGAKAAELYRRLAQTWSKAIQYQRLPSTSPAHAMPPGAKLAAWRAICAPIGSTAQPGEPGRRHRDPAYDTGGRRWAHGLCGFDLRGQRQQRRLVVGPADELHRHRKSVAVEVPRHDRRGLAGQIPDLKVRNPLRDQQQRRHRTPALVGADAGRARRGARRDDDVDIVEDRLDPGAHRAPRPRAWLPSAGPRRTIPTAPCCGCALRDVPGEPARPRRR